MPGVDGLELVRRYRADPATSLIPIIVLSTKEEPAIKSEAFKAGANAAAAELSSTVGVGFIGTGPSWKKTRPEVTGTAIARPKSRKS
jgi:CheY-like chemotaxis protein